MFLDMLREEDKGAGGAAAPAAEPPAAAAPAPGATAPETPSAEAQEIARLKAENEALKNRQPQEPPAPAKVTSATLDGYTEDQWTAIEAKTGKDRATIIREFKDWEITQKQNALEAKSNVSDMIQEELEKDPRLLKLRGSIKEFLAEVPLADQLDPTKLKRAMEKAIIYARGKHMSAPAPQPSGTPAPKTPAPNAGGDDGGDGTVEGEIKDDEYISPTGLRIKTGKVNKETWKRIRHQEKDPNSVSIPADFDEKPKFK
jgi:hypothetical protein